MSQDIAVQGAEQLLRAAEAFEVPSIDDGASPPGESEVGDQNQNGRRERKRQQLSCADCHRRKQKCDRNIPCKTCIDRGVGHLCHIAEAGTNKRKPQATDEYGNPKVPRKRRKRNEIEADAARDLIVARARSVITKAAAGDEQAIGQLQRFVGEATYPEDQPSYVGPASIQNFITSSGGSTSFMPLLPAMPLTLGGADLLIKMPPRELCDHLVEVFQRNSRASYTIQYTPVALARYYENLWQVVNLRQSTRADQELLPGTVQPVSHAFVCMVNMCCVLALQMLPAESRPFVTTFGDLLELRRGFYSTAREALMRSELEELPDLCRIEAITMIGSFLKNEGRPNDQYILHASAIRAAQALGMHRHASSKWGIDPFDNEMRRRVWWALYAYDRYASFHLGRPPVIQDIHCDVALPMNLNRVDLMKGNWGATKPLQEYTDSTFLISECILGTTVGRIFDRAFATHSPDYSTVLELDTELQTMENNLPPALRAPTPNDKLAYPGIETIHRMFMLIICKIRVMLHRPFLLKPYPPPGQTDEYARSRQISVMLSRQQIIFLRALLEDVPAHMKNNFLFSHNAWEAGCQLAVAVHALPVTADNLSEAKKLDTQVLQARALLEELSLVNRTAANALRMVDFLRSRYAAQWSLDAPVVPIGPMAIVETAPVDPQLQAHASGSSSESSGQTPATSNQDIDSPHDPFAFLLAPDIASEQPVFNANNEWSSIGGVFETGANWSQSLDMLLSQVGELV